MREHDREHMTDGTPQTSSPAPLGDEPSPNDVSLAIAARDGDRSAFAQLVERYHRLIYKIAYHKCNHAGDAEDVTQEVFLHAFRSLPKLRDPQAFLGWLLAIAHHRGNRFCRRRQAKVIAFEEARKELRAGSERQERAAGLAPNGEAGEAEPNHLGQLVGSLPDEFRLALTWKYLDGCSYDQIGERLSMSFNQVDYLLRRAKKALRQVVSRESQKREGKSS
ncbi:MAG: RNA polymerase sigma factor [Planctomycetota bacterium]